MQLFIELKYVLKKKKRLMKKKTHFIDSMFVHTFVVVVYLFGSIYFESKEDRRKLIGKT